MTLQSAPLVNRRKAQRHEGTMIEKINQYEKQGYKYFSTLLYLLISCVFKDNGITFPS